MTENEDVYSAVEEEKQEENEEIKTPFDPNKIDVDIATVNLGFLIEQLRDNEIDLAPDFQRAATVWDKAKKSRLIESILLGLPLPSFYFSEDAETGKLQIIDGIQRISALSDFILEKENPLRLESLQFLAENYSGKCYDDLGQNDKRRINKLKITINTLRKTTPVKVKYVIFQRVNTGGVPLTAQEMRNALNPGQPAKFIKRLAETPTFRNVCNISPKRMSDRDFANRFVAFYLNYDKYYGDLDMFLNDCMVQLGEFTDENLDSLVNVFEKSISCCHDIFGNGVFRKPSTEGEVRKPISKSLFDSLAVNVAWLTDEERVFLTSKADEFKMKFYRLLGDSDFLAAITSSTASRTRVTKRFGDVKNIINEVIGYDWETNNR